MRFGDPWRSTPLSVITHPRQPLSQDTAYKALYAREQRSPASTQGAFSDGNFSNGISGEDITYALDAIQTRSASTEPVYRRRGSALCDGSDQR